ncbi:MAG: hypothetical protein ACM3S1_06930 [Hyphomicrobiales bacterium]
MATDSWNSDGDLWEKSSSTPLSEPSHASWREFEEIKSFLSTHRPAWNHSLYPDQRTTALLTLLASGGGASGSFPSAATEPEAEPGPVVQIATTYLGLVEDLEWVVRVSAAEGDPGAVLTIIDAPPFDREFRRPIFEAELKALERIPDVAPEFILVNINELAAQGREWSALPGETLLLER